MRTLFNIVALLLVAIWLPVSSHCALEEAGLWNAHEVDSGGGCCSKHGVCPHDGCQTVEGGFTLASHSTVKAPQPLLHFSLCITGAIIELPILTELLLEEVKPGVEYRVEWVPERHFERRAVQSPRAPSLALA